MAETTEFNHDQLGHILIDHLTEVPRFQRSYAWDAANVDEYLSDLDSARKKNVAYFMGTLVFAQSGAGSDRRQVVDGQQRLATTAVLLIAVRDLLKQYGHHVPSEKTEQRYLRRYVLSEEGYVVTLILSPKDQDSYDALLEGRSLDLDPKDKLRICYEACYEYLRRLAPNGGEYRRLIELTEQLERSVQVLVAVATDLPEAYVIFETLNDRGADLTTADLLKNYLFSQAKSSEFAYVETTWTQLEAKFNKSEDLVKFVRYEYVSRNGPTTTRKLYRALQEELAGGLAVKKYLQGLKASQAVYLALRDPDDEFWAAVSVDVRDAILAYRRFGFESSMPVLLAAFANWDRTKAARLFVKVAKWSVRAQFVGRIGGSLSEEVFGGTSAAISGGKAKNQVEVRKVLARLIPTDAEFKAAFAASPAPQTMRAKYLLAMLEKAHDEKNGVAQRSLDWSGVGITIEHVMAKSAGSNEELTTAISQLGNLALLEKRINRDLGSKPFSKKKSAYSGSDFHLTQELANETEWTVDQITARTQTFAELACLAWPSK